MKACAAIAGDANRPLEIEEIDFDGSKAGEGLARIVTTSVCHGERDAHHHGKG